VIKVFEFVKIYILIADEVVGDDEDDDESKERCNRSLHIF